MTIPVTEQKSLGWERKNKPLRIKLKTRDDVAGVYIFPAKTTIDLANTPEVAAKGLEILQDVHLKEAYVRLGRRVLRRKRYAMR